MKPAFLDKVFMFVLVAVALIGIGVACTMLAKRLAVFNEKITRSIIVATVRQ